MDWEMVAYDDVWRKPKQSHERTVTLITDVSTLEGGLWTWAAAAMFAMVLRWFIWLMAMVTDAGGRLTGMRGWGIIIKGSSSPVKNTHISPLHGANKTET